MKEGGGNETRNIIVVGTEPIAREAGDANPNVEGKIWSIMKFEQLPEIGVVPQDKGLLLCVTLEDLYRRK